MANRIAVEVNLLEKAEEVVTKLDPRMAARLSNLLDLALDCQNRSARFQPALVLNNPEPEQVGKLMDLVRAYKAERRMVDILMDDDSITLIF